MRAGAPPSGILRGHGWVALVVLGFSIVLEAVSMKGCMDEVNRIRGDRGIWSWLNQSRNSELVAVFGEDLAALLGLTIAFVFVAIAMVTGDGIHDAYGSIAIGVLVIIVSLFVANRGAKLLIGRSADPEVVAALREAIDRDDDIAEVLNVITVQVGPQIMLAAKVRMRSGLSMAEGIGHITPSSGSCAIRSRISAGSSWSPIRRTERPPRSQCSRRTGKRSV